MDSSRSERRLSTRREMRKPGRIVFNRAFSTIDCRLSDHSEHGARLDVTSVLGIPNVFELRVDGHAARMSRVVWRKAEAIGVEFASN
jgi:hypothetical protein